MLSTEQKKELIAAAAQRFDCPYYVETGTGDGQLLHDLAAAQVFQRYHTIDINRTTVRKAYVKYHHLPGTHFWGGDSADRLKPIIKRLQKPTVFWLAAHHGDPRFNKDGPGQSPILTELQTIADHILADKHVIFVDGMDLYGKKNRKYRTFVKTADIVEAIKTNWPNWSWTVEDGVGRLYPEPANDD